MKITTKVATVGVLIAASKGGYALGANEDADDGGATDRPLRSATAFPSASPGASWGATPLGEGLAVGYRVARGDARRHSSLELGYAVGGDWSRPSIGGHHVWFTNRGLGLGVRWSVESRRRDASLDVFESRVTIASLGAVVMFRHGR